MTHPPARPPSTPVSTVLDDYFAHYYQRNPVTATFTGVHAHDERLPDWSPAGRARELREMHALHARLVVAHPLPAVGYPALRDDPVALDAELARANLEVRIAEFESGHFHTRNPALWTGEAIFACVSLMIRPFAPFEERLVPLRARLVAIPDFLTTMRTAVGDVVTTAWRQRAQRECMAANELLSAGLEQWLQLHAPSNDRHSVHTESATPQLLESVLTAAALAREAFAAAAIWLSERPDAEGFSVACGEELLTLLLRRGHFYLETPRHLLAQATAAVDDAMEALAPALAPFDGALSRAQSAMAEDRCTADDYYGAFLRRWQEIRTGVSRHDAVTWPDWPIRYVPIPAWARNSALQLYWLFYRSPAPFDPYDVYDYVVTPIDETIDPETQRARLGAWNRSVITLNHVVHHGGLGHHVQNWHARYRSTSRVGTVAAVDAASRIGMFLGGSMAEGWACYATGLTEEMGLLSDLEVVSERHTRVRLLARAVVDLRLHLGDWSFDDGVEFYQSRVGMSYEVAFAEATKNSMFPATALMYWLGMDAIRDLRATLEGAESDSTFSLRAFHDELLSRGAIPVLLATQLMTGKR